MVNMSGNEMRRSALKRSLVGLALLMASPAAAATMEGWEVHGASYSGDHVICDDPKIDTAAKQISCPGEVLPELTVWEKSSQMVGISYLVFSALIIAAYIHHRLQKEPDTVFFEANGMKLCFAWSVISWLLIAAMFSQAIWQWIMTGFPSERLF